MIYLGLSQWNYKFFIGNLYPEDSKPNEYIEYYSAEFNCVELNSTYYDEVSPNVIAKWKRSVGPSFKYCPKFPKSVSHEKILSNVQQEVNNFIESVKQLGDNLGVCFLQLPLQLDPSRMYLLDELLIFINKRIKVSVEIRPDWLARQDILNECLAVLKKHTAGIVMVDGAETIKYLNNLKLTNSTAFIRFLAYKHSTDFDRINDWAKLIKFWQAKGMKEIYFMLHFSDGDEEPEILEYTKNKFKSLNGA